jgi:5-methylcytosine-specific restriction endonuclease McrA
MPTHKPRKRTWWRQHALAPRKPDDRPSSSQRGYDVAWQRLRIWFLRRNPFCVVCLQSGRYESATEVDHKVPIAAGGERLNQNNLQGLCGDHHRKKTAKDRKKYSIYARKDDMIS